MEEGVGFQSTRRRCDNTLRRDKTMSCGRLRTLKLGAEEADAAVVSNVLNRLLADGE